MTSRLLGEYREPDALVRAIESLRSKGYRSIEAYMPYPVQGVDEALQTERSRLPWIVFVVGMSAAIAAYWLQWLLNAYLYPLDVGKRPPHFPLSYVPITFEMGVLFASFAAFMAVLGLGRLLRLWQPVFEVEGFRSVTRDGFWIEIRSSDKRFDPERTTKDLEESGAAQVVALGELP